MVQQVTTNFPKDLYTKLEEIREKVGEPSTEDFIVKLVTGGLILIDQELARRALVVTPDIVGPDGRYVGRRIGG